MVRTVIVTRRRSAMSSSGILLCGLCSLAPVMGRAQETAAPSSAPSASDTEAAIERALDRARTGSPAVRPQAARRLLQWGSLAAERVLREMGEDPAQLVRLGPDLIAVLGEFHDARIRDRLWSATLKPDFPYRGAAARTLAGTAAAPIDPSPECARFEALLTDVLPEVRVAAADALKSTGRADLERRLRGLLEDPNDRVRRKAACVIFDRGDRSAAFWLLEDLRRCDAFFELDTGRSARTESLQLLQGRLSDLGGYDLGRSAADPENLAALQAVQELILGNDDPPQLPRIALAAVPSTGDLVGLEVRSCRHGELFLRWNASGGLLVGTGNPAAVALPVASIEKIAALAREAAAALGDRHFFGIPGCDYEQLYVMPESSDRPIVIRCAKGVEPLPDLRPQLLNPLMSAMLSAVPDESAAQDPRLVLLRSRLAVALSAIGGPID